MTELRKEIKGRFNKVDKHYQSLSERQFRYGDPMSERLMKIRHDLKICLDALEADGDDDGSCLPPQK